MRDLNMSYVKMIANEISTLTNLNHHGDAIEYAIEKLFPNDHEHKQDYLNEIAYINKEHDLLMYLSPELNDRRYNLYTKMMNVFKERYPDDYDNIYQAF